MEFGCEEVKAYKCVNCNSVYLEKEEADRCCKCKSCKNYIGKFSNRSGYVHCSYGYTCDSYASEGKKGTYSRFE